MHAAAIAAELEIDRILCPRAGGVLSALGLCASDRRQDTARTVMLSGDRFSQERVAAAVEELISGLESGTEAEPEVIYEMRYAGQAFELPVGGSTRPDPADLAERFAAAHKQLYGHRDPEAEVVLVHIRLAMITSGARPRPRAAAGQLERGSRQVRFDGRWVETPVLRGEPGAGAETEGPVVFELPESTLVVPPGWATEVDEAGTIVAEQRR
jgi:N-methylhydantoinase A